VIEIMGSTKQPIESIALTSQSINCNILHSPSGTICPPYKRESLTRYPRFALVHDHHSYLSMDFVHKLTGDDHKDDKKPKPAPPPPAPVHHESSGIIDTIKGAFEPAKPAPPPPAPAHKSEPPEQHGLVTVVDSIAGALGLGEQPQAEAHKDAPKDHKDEGLAAKLGGLSLGHKPAPPPPEPGLLHKIGDALGGGADHQHPAPPAQGSKDAPKDPKKEEGLLDKIGLGHHHEEPKKKEGLLDKIGIGHHEEPKKEPKKEGLFDKILGDHGDKDKKDKK
jgi:hypothetical protein